MANDIRQKLAAAQKLFDGTSTSVEKLSAVSSLLQGVHPRIDSVLAECERHLSFIGMVQNGESIMLSADLLPENTEEEKKRKKAVLVFIRSWNELESEVARVRSEFDSQKADPSHGSVWRRIFRATRGPLIVVTVIAAGIVLMSQTSVDIRIENKGCGTLYPSSSIPVTIPGLVFPSEPLVSGGSVTATIPPLMLSIDGTKPGTLSITSLSLHFSMQLSNQVASVTFDGEQLVGKKTDVRLSDAPTHRLVMTCRT
jgi:hypothetical protein